MSRVNFTVQRVQLFACESDKSQSFLWDSDSPGLGLRATPNGNKKFIFQSKIAGLGIDPRISIGDASSWRLPEARAKAREYKVLADQGIDPRSAIASKRSSDDAANAALERKAARESVTLKEVWPIYLAERQEKWGKRHYQNHENLAAAGGQIKKKGKGLTVAGPLASLMPTLLSDLTSDKIEGWLNHEAKTRPTNATQSFRILRTLIRWTEETPLYCGIVPTGAYSSRKVRDATPKNETRIGDSLQREQLELWFHGVRQINNQYRSAYLQALLLTGARRTELTELLWENVDFQWKQMIIGDKVEGERTIPLTPYLAHILNLLPRKNKWVFYSARSASGHTEEPKDAHAKALAAVGLPHISIHGLRRSFGTLAEWVEIPVGVVAQINGHKPSALAEKHYRRRPIDMLRMWHEKIEAWILEEAKVTWTRSD